MRCCLATVVPLLRGGSWWCGVCCGGVWWCWRVVLLVVSSMTVERVRRVRTRDGRAVWCVALQCRLDGCFRRRCCEWASHARTLRRGVPRRLRHAGSSQGLCRVFL
ncbi:hypothetical protein BPORC_1783 [Bifidobacterium porcinum]|nr:hypothetical protein BPORC_1783 [Bifidobacterium porcinum]